jgi:hypothetical protein
MKNVQDDKKRALSANGLEGIVYSQEYEGYWEKLEAWDRMIVNWDAIGEFDARVMMTVLALALLMKDGAGKEVVWGLVAEKGKNWLSEQNAGIEWNDVIAEVMSQLG